MNCRHSRRLFSRHLDDRLSGSEREALDAHLSGCAECRAELVRWEVPSLALRATRTDPPEGLADRAWRATLASISRSPQASFEERFVWAARRAAAVGALAAVVIWGGLLWGDTGSGETTELVHPPDAVEMATSLWAPDPATEGSFDVD
ncbi:MAG TPA: zf-HC2 domain-containing protein [Kofleriaceae bacterium]|nr:zf-HC2 domain-containing protein [Kofleriaceae bacterium]